MSPDSKGKYEWRVSFAQSFYSYSKASWRGTKEKKDGVESHIKF